MPDTAKLAVFHGPGKAFEIRGSGGDVVLEQVSHPIVIDEGLRMTAPEGTYLEIGNINVGWKAEFDK
jgi:hypothetical protein